VGLFGRSAESEEATGRALARTRRSWIGRLGGLFGGGVTPELWESLEEVLIGADTGVRTTMDLLERVRAAGPRDAEHVRELLALELVALLEGPASHAQGRLWGPGAEPPPSPAVVLVIGVNGSGKTTGIARLAHAYEQDGTRVVCAAGDTFRAAAIDQLRTWGERLGVDVIAHQPGADPAAVAFDTIEAARARGHEIVLVDTAGRLHNKKNLMDELAKVRRVIERQLGRGPDEVLLVLDATTGQNGLAQARAFTELAEVTSVMLTKLDGSARGGIVFAIASELGLPVRFVGVGQEAGDLAPFDPASFVSALLTEPAPTGT
jgi:fused signal recognition particle receptor